MSSSIIIDIQRRTTIMLDEISRTLTSIQADVFRQPQGNWPIWKQFYHLLYWLDFWFVDPNDFEPPSFHVENLLDSKDLSHSTLSKQQLMTYFASIRAKIEQYAAGITLGELERSYEVRTQTRSRFDMMLGQFKHVSHHLGYICSVYRACTGYSIWTDTKPRG
jgi:hypothetical protein